ncbi:MAG: preprotein translocase subunit YajC [Dehalococcoidales bacterium]|nr:MAG: preprotein translocase subunit YajC [Dehalococcoidales bacterium]
MRKKQWYLVVMVGLVTVMTLIGGCIPVDTGTDGEESDTGSFITSIWPMLIFIVLLFAMMYFVMIRPQRRRQREHRDFVEQLHRGDKVVTAGGIYGEVESVSEENVVLKIESGTTIRIAKSSIVTKQYEEEPRIG